MSLAARAAVRIGAFVVAIATAGAWPNLAQADGAAGLATLTDHLTIADRLAVRATGLDPLPDGSGYRVWLASDDGKKTLLVGSLAVTAEGEGALVFEEPAGESLLLQFSQIRVTIGPAQGNSPQAPVLQGRIDPLSVAQLRRLVVRWPDSRYGVASLQGLRKLAATAEAQAAVLREAAASGDLAAMRRKAEHLVNLIEGQRGAFFGDHNGDGRIEDPGDGVGYLPYAWGAVAQSQSVWAGAASDDVAEQALAVRSPVLFGLEWAGFVRDTGRELAGTTDLPRARELTVPILDAVQRMVASIDPRADPALDRVREEWQIVAAYEQAQTLLSVALSPPAVVG